jgi:hypothetical protein
MPHALGFALPARASVRTMRLKLGTPVTLLPNPNKHWVGFDVSPDGDRSLMVLPEVVASEQPLTSLLNVIPKG